MAERKPPSDAMVDLCAAVNRAGSRRFDHRWVDIRPRQVEEWLQDDLIPGPERPGLGQARGRAAAYTDEHAERLVEVADLMRTYRSKHVVAAVLFLRGREVPERRLRDGYLGMLDRQAAETEKAAERGLRRFEEKTEEPPHPPAGGWSPDELAEWAEPTVADRLSRSERTIALRKELSVRTDVGAAIRAIAFGLATRAMGSAEGDPELVPVLLKGLGLLSDETSALAPNPPTVDRVRGVTKRATLADFESARRSMNLLESILVHDDPTSKLLEPATAVLGQLESERGRALGLLIPLALAGEAGIEVKLLEETLARFLAEPDASLGR